jgi:CheY-like chemotaxis protein
VGVGFKILVVEDTADFREVIRLVLEAEGYRVLEAENGVVAVDTARREQPDAILMDMSLPLVDGCQATRLIRRLPRLGTIPIIAVTAYNQWDWRGRAILAGCTDFLTKPVRTRDLLVMLSRYLPTDQQQSAHGS